MGGHLKTLPKRMVGTFWVFPDLTTKELPCHVAIQRLNDLEASNWTNNNIQWNHQQFESRVLMAHNTLNGIMSPWAWIFSGRFEVTFIILWPIDLYSCELIKTYISVIGLRLWRYRKLPKICPFWVNALPPSLIPSFLYRYFSWCKRCIAGIF